MSLAAALIYWIIVALWLAVLTTVCVTFVRNPRTFGAVLGNPGYLILPKVMNVVAACAVLGLLVLRWLPVASKERADADADMHLKNEALTQETEERRRL